MTKDITVDGNLTNVTTVTSGMRLLIIDSGVLKDVTAAVLTRYLENNMGQSVLNADFNITGTTGTYQDTGLSISLPEAGTYLIIGDIRGRIQMATGTSLGITVKLYNSTDAADVANSFRRVVSTFGTDIISGNTPMSVKVAVTAAKIIKLYTYRDFDGTVTTSDIAGSATVGQTSLSYVRVGS